MKTLLLLLYSFFLLPVDADPAEDAADPDPNAVADDAADPDPDADADPDPALDADHADLDAADPEPKRGRAASDIARLREERRSADERADRFERELAEIRRRDAASQSEEARLRAEEDAVLRDPAADAQRKWQIEANRTLRANRAESQQALIAAQDLQDKTAFGQLAVTKPALYKRYEGRVEKALADMRSKGQNANREAIMRFLIGDDAIKGELKSAPAAKKVNRGATPGARADVNGKGGKSDRDKRMARLDGQQI